MSRLDPDEIDRLALWVPCAHCGQDLEWCVTKSGTWARYLHGARYSPIREAYALGYMEADAYHRTKDAEDG